MSHKWAIPCALTLAQFMLHEKYSDEAQFRNRFLRPLLTRLGYVSIAELHGTLEFGKDFVFSELSPFGFLRHHAAVVKHEKAIRQSSQTSCNTILSQVRQAFSVCFKLPESETENRVSSVFVFNSGSISDNAKMWLRSELDEERYGRNVHILDGERLYQLNLNSTFRQGSQLLPKLQGIQNDLNLSILIWQSILNGLPKFQEARGSFTAALEQFLAAPFFTDRVDPNSIATLLQESRIIDRVNFRNIESFTNQNRVDLDCQTIRTVLQKAIPRARKILVQVSVAMHSIKPLTEVES